MEIVIQKFGGSSLANTEKLMNVCKIIINEYEKNKGIVVVVSAQGKTTDKLIQEECEITDKINKREHDVLVSVGEQITIAKLSMCLTKLGYSAVSYLGWQVPIITDNNFTDATIKDIKTDKLLDELNNKKIVIIAGFQGVSENGNITTLGRGGSDTTAVAIAAALNAKNCYIYTDVDGVYTTDPNKNKISKKIDFLTYDEMLKMSNAGATVLHNKCVKIAKENNIAIYVKSSLKPYENGTCIK